MSVEWAHTAEFYIVSYSKTDLRTWHRQLRTYRVPILARVQIPALRTTIFQRQSNPPKASFPRQPSLVFWSQCFLPILPAQETHVSGADELCLLVLRNGCILWRPKMSKGSGCWGIGDGHVSGSMKLHVSLTYVWIAESILMGPSKTTTNENVVKSLPDVAAPICKA